MSYLPLVLISALIHTYIGWRLLPDLALGSAGIIGGISALLLSCLLIAAGLLARSIRRQPLSDRLAWVGLIAVGLFSSLFVLTVLRDHNVALVSSERERKELNAAYREAREAMTRVIAESARGDLAIGINIRCGEPVDAIACCATDYDANLLVIGARELRALSRFVLGSTAYKVLTTVECPIFVVQEAAIRKARALPVEPAFITAPVAPAADPSTDHAPMSYFEASE